MTNDQTFIAFKPDAIDRGLVGEILALFEAEGFTIAHLKTVEASDELLERHYAEHTEKDFYDGLVEYMQERPVIVGILEGDDVVSAVREMLGETNPAEADPETIRGEYGIDSRDKADTEDRATRNLLHASATVEEAKREIDLWFDS